MSPLDRRSRGVGGRLDSVSPWMVQELLNRSSSAVGRRDEWPHATATFATMHPWSGRHTWSSISEAIFDGEAYADFALLWHVAHRSRLEPRVPSDAEEGRGGREPTGHSSKLDEGGRDEVRAARDRLRDGVQQSIEALCVASWPILPIMTEVRPQVLANSARRISMRELLRLV